MRMPKCALAALVAALAASAEVPSGAATAWSGPFGLEVRIEDHRGRDLEGAEVTLTWLEDARGGPSPARSGGDGRVRFSGLAPGRWELVARREGQMTYVAEIIVTSDKPQVVTARHENVRGAIAPMRLRVTKGPMQVGAVAQPPAESRAPAPAERRRADEAPAVRPAAPPTPVPPAPTALPPSAPEGSAGAREPEPVRAPPALAPTATPVPVVAATATPAPKPVPTPVASAPQAPVPEAAAPVAVTPRPAAQAVTPTPPPRPAPTAGPGAAPAPAPVAVAQPAATVAPTVPPAVPSAAPSAVPAGAPSPVAVSSRLVEPPLLRRHADKTCAECPPGEASLSVEVALDGSSSGVGCPPEAVSAFAGLPAAQWAAGAERLPSTCAALVLELPARARFTGYRYEAAADGRYQDCPAGRDCPGLNGSWAGDPLVVKEGGTTRLAALFGNRAERSRRARFTAYFREGRR